MRSCRKLMMLPKVLLSSLFTDSLKSRGETYGKVGLLGTTRMEERMARVIRGRSHTTLRQSDFNDF
jgi:hypothetical protein